MRKIGQRSLAPRETTGPRVGAVVTRGGVTIRVLESGEQATLPAATVLADDATADAIKRAAAVVAGRIQAHALQPIPLRIMTPVEIVAWL